MTQIDWVRATFTGAVVGGLVWALIVRLASWEFAPMVWQARAVLVAVVVNAILLVVSWLLWRSAPDGRGRTRAASLWIVPFLGIAFFAAMLTIGIGYGALRGS